MQSDVQKIADRYEHIVYWSDEDRCYIGRCPELFFGGVHGDNVDAVFRELRQVVEENVILHQEQGSLPEPRHAVSRAGKAALGATTVTVVIGGKANPPTRSPLTSTSSGQADGHPDKR